MAEKRRGVANKGNGRPPARKPARDRERAITGESLATVSTAVDKLARTIREMPVEQLRAVLKRDRAFTFRLSEVDRETMDKASDAMGLSVAEYLIRVHYMVYDVLEDAGVVE